MIDMKYNFRSFFQAFFRRVSVSL